jgi:hypothetical protein
MGLVDIFGVDWGNNECEDAWCSCGDAFCRAGTAMLMGRVFVG